MNNNIKIVIVGAGFAGIVTLKELAKSIASGNLKNASITLVDRKDYHLYYPNIYELASSEEEFVSIQALKKSVALPIKDFLPKTANFVQGELQQVNQNEKHILVSGNKIAYDYLVLALGSVSDDFGIPGVSENSVALCSLHDALKIRDKMELMFQAAANETQKKHLRVIFGGGGFTGIELCAEMLNFAEILSWKYSYPAEKIEFMIIEGGNQLLPGFPSEISSTIYHRLRNFQVNILLNKFISQADQHSVTAKDGEVINYDLFIWTGGVKSAKIPWAAAVEQDRKGRAMTNPDLSVSGYPNVFVVGDDACVMDDQKHVMPQTATQAIFHAEYVAGAIAAKIKGKTVPPHQCKPSPFIIPVKGKWAIMHLPSGFTMQGVVPWIIKSLATLRYFSRLIPFGKALKLVWFEDKLYTKND